MAAPLRRLASLEYTDDEKIDRLIGPEPKAPDYPEGLSFSLGRDDLGKICEGPCEPGMTLQFMAMGEALSVYRGTDEIRIEVEFCMMAGADGKFAEMDQPPCICLCGSELEKLDLADDAEKGDMIHIIGTAKIVSTSSPRYGEDGVSLQIVEAAIEDESTEGMDNG